MVKETLNGTGSKNQLICYGQDLKIEIVRSSTGTVKATTFTPGGSARSQLTKTGP